MNKIAAYFCGKYLDFFYPHRHNEPIGVISGKFRCVYLPVPKVANKSVKKWLMDQGAFQEEDYERLVGNISAETQLVSKSLLEPGTFVFAFVRNPWDRLVSCFCDKIRTSKEDNPWMTRGVYNGFVKYGMFHSEMTFREFVRAVSIIPDSDADVHFRSQTRFLTDSRGKWLPDYLGRFEALADGIRKISEILKLSGNIPFPHINKVERPGYREFYTPDLKAQVAGRYAEDVKRLQYEF